MARGRFTPRRSTVGLVVVLLVVGATTALVLDVMTTAGARHRASDAPLFDRSQVALDAASPTAGFALQPSALRTDLMATGCITVLVGDPGAVSDGPSAAPAAVVLHGRARSGDVLADPSDGGVRLRISAEAGRCPDRGSGGDVDDDLGSDRVPPAQPGKTLFDGPVIDLTTEHPELENGLTLATVDRGAADDRNAIAVTATASIEGNPDLDRLADLLLTVELGSTG